MRGRVMELRICVNIILDPLRPVYGWYREFDLPPGIDRFVLRSLKILRVHWHLFLPVPSLMLVEGKISQRIVQRVHVNFFLVQCGVVCPRRTICIESLFG
jgi:hypothetical protein